MATQQYNSGSAVPRTADTTAGGGYAEYVTVVPGAQANLLTRLQVLVDLWILEGGDGDCPDETDTDLVAGNVLQ